MLNKDELNTLADEIRKVIFDNSDMIISVGYCVKSKNGIIFRKLSK
jgi:CRISPR/Cas system-associated endoribonuclease Cas2